MPGRRRDARRRLYRLRGGRNKIVIDARKLYESTVARAEDSFERRDYAAALAGYRSALTGRLEQLAATGAAFSGPDAAVVEQMADLSVLFGHFEAAASLLDALRQLFAQAGNEYAADYSSVRLMAVRLAQYRYEQAAHVFAGMACNPGPIPAIDFTPEGIRSWEATLDWPNTTPPDRAILRIRMLLEIGHFATSHGQYQAAISALEYGLRRCVTAPPSPLIDATRLPLLIALATAHAEKGDLVRANDLVRQARMAKPSPPLEVGLLEIEARLMLLQGDLGLARKKLEQSADRCAELRIPHAAALAQLNLAQLLVSLNQLSAALTSIAQAEAGVANGVVKARAVALRRLVSARARSLADGVAIAPSVTELWATPSPKPETIPIESGPVYVPSSDYGFLDLFEVRCLTLHWLLGEHDYQGARRYLAELHAVFGDTDSSLIRGRMSHFGGLLAYYLGDFSESERLLALADHYATETGALFDQWQILRALGWVFTRVGANTNAASCRERSEAILESLAASLDPLGRTAFRLNKWTAEEERLWAECEKLIALQGAANNGSRLHRPRLRWVLLRRATATMERIDAYRQGISGRQHARTGDDHPVNRVSWIRNVAIAFRRAILRFVVLPDRVVMILQRGWTIRVAVSPVSRVALREMVADCHRSLRGSAPTSQPQRLLAMSQALQLDAVLDLLPSQVRELRILPDDSLHGIPFAALPVRGGVLADRLAVSIGVNWRLRRPAGRGRRGLLVALPRGDEEFEPLPGVKVEGRIVEEWWRQQGVVVSKPNEQTITVAEIQTGLTRAEYLHLACHGVFKPDDPGSSGLVVISERGREGLLSMRDLATLDLENVLHATVSTCWGADNFVLPGRHVISMPETMIRSGVRNVMACLWKVADDVSPYFLRCYYESLAEMRPAAALRVAQARIKKGSMKVNASDALYWAGFQVYVDD